MDDNIMHVAALHYVHEQSARHLRIWEAQETAVPTPDFETAWKAISPRVRDEYIKRAELFVKEKPHVEAQGDYRSYLSRLYTEIYAGKSRADAVTSSCIDSTWFERYFQKGTQEDRPQRVQDLSDSEKYYDDSDTSADEEDDTVHEAPMDYDILDQEDPALLEMEETVRKGASALKNLRESLGEADAQTGNIDWKKEIQETLRFDTPGRVAIGVVGSTGVGKSSIINAIIDEENLLPTNCMRAATAVATEILHHDGELNYKAHIRFIERDQWERELKILLGDISDDQDYMQSGRVKKDSETAIALAKIKAVYPSLDSADLVNTSVETLLEDERISGLLGRTRTISSNNAKSFARALKYYVDSRVVENAPNLEEAREIDSNTRLWPLIEMVRIFTKAKALSTGAVLVDLPGVGDSNAARSAVASEYAKKCSVHWIVAPINRAVDDRVSRDLLGENFKRQMQMDLAFNDITFICSKTDEIHTGEVQDSLGLTVPSMQAQKAGQRRQKQLQNGIKVLNVQRKMNEKELSQIDDQIEAIDGCLFPDMAQALPDSDCPSRKRKINVANSSNGRVPPNSYTSDRGILSPQEMRSMKNKRVDLQGERKRLVNHRKTMDATIKQQKNEIQQIRKECEDLETPIICECIDARNEYSKKEIRQDFASGIRDLDREQLGHMEDEESDEAEPGSLHDYKKLEQELPVFCVSARAYQKLRGRSRRVKNIVDFNDITRTEIPQLQRHCLSLTKKSRLLSARRFLVKLSRLLLALRLWSSATNPTQILTQEKKAEIESGFDDAVKSLREDMETFRQELLSKLREIFESDIYKYFDKACIRGSEGFVRSVARWNSKREDGGFHHRTYSAFCRRLGIHKGKDLNEDLANPMRCEVVPHWTRMFGIQLPRQMDLLAKRFLTSLHVFHARALMSADRDIRERKRRALGESLKTQCKDVEQEVKGLEARAQANAKEVNRLFIQIIANQLKSTYDLCAAVKGRRLLARIRDTMTFEAENNGSNIFQLTAERVQDGLEKLLETTGEEITTLIDSAVDRLRRVYYTAIIDAQIKKYSEDQLRLKKNVLERIRRMEESLNLKKYVDVETTQELHANPGPSRENLSGVKEKTEKDYKF